MLLTFFFPTFFLVTRDSDGESEDDEDEDEAGIVNVAVEWVDCYDALFPASGKETKGTDLPVADVMVDICLSLMSRYTLSFSTSLCGALQRGFRALRPFSFQPLCFVVVLSLYSHPFVPHL